jgi:hypothetical protein
MDQSALLAQLQAQLPDFWTKQIEGLPTLLNAYSYVYGSALQKWQMIANELSPFTTDPYLTDFYKVIDLKQTIIPSDPSMNGDGNFYYELPLGTFLIDTLSRDLTFNNSLTFNILLDTVLNKTLLQIPVTQLTSTDRYLYIRQYLIDNGNMLNTWGSLFPGIKPFINTDLDFYTNITSYTQQINSDQYQQYLLNIKAQICAFIRCATLGGTIDSLESIFSIAYDQPYVTQDGFIVNFDEWNTWIESNGEITQYSIGPKPKFQQPNASISAYEAIGVCPVDIYSYVMNPARFIQVLLANQSANLFDLLTLAPNELPTALYFDMPHLTFDPNNSDITFDFGILLNNQVKAPSYSYGLSSLYYHYYDFSSWTNPGLSPTVYLFFKNLIICEISPVTSYANPSLSWINSILEYFRPLHVKYLSFIQSTGS